MVAAHEPLLNLIKQLNKKTKINIQGKKVTVQKYANSIEMNDTVWNNFETVDCIWCILKDVFIIGLYIQCVYIIIPWPGLNKAKGPQLEAACTGNN